MINLSAYKEDSFKFYQDVLAKKNKTQKDPGYHTRMATLDNDIKTLFAAYDTAFNNSNLTSLKAHGYVDPHKNDLSKLYSYRSQLLQKLKIEITTIDQERLINTCQNCTINSVNSFDHVAPQAKFCEYSVHPKNLFPSCNECNGYKSDTYSNNNSPRLFLNLYIDSLPPEQYLYTTLNITQNLVEVKFYLANNYGINNSMFDLLEHHYDKLRLLTRFTENMDEVITSLKNTILVGLESQSEADIKDMVVKRCALDKKYFGSNFWKSVLTIDLVNSRAYWDKLIYAKNTNL